MSQTQQRWRASGWGADKRVGLGLWLACQRLEQTGKTADVGSGAGVGEGHSCKCGVTTIFRHSLTVDIQYLYTKLKQTIGKIKGNPVSDNQDLHRCMFTFCTLI